MGAQLSVDLLVDVTSRVLMEAAFIMAEPVSDPPPMEGELLEARIGFSGPCKGVTVIVVNDRMATTLAANFLGLEPDDELAIAKRGDAIGELLNIIGGYLLGEVCEPTVPGLLGLPEVKPSSLRAEGSLPAGTEVASLLTDEGDCIEVLLQLES